ncbi:hypothetical protein ElyMa_000187000 [Elysia marginata]|uniref:Uncharacterized protein n=1 Tax=Elysia marginata TaxID=1093978 RepID=A0AAV4EWB4_9GAST|nr:hypothetical protein ElyMa_000187000 [Elysia marginata]
MLITNIYSPPSTHLSFKSINTYSISHLISIASHKLGVCQHGYMWRGATGWNDIKPANFDNKPYDTLTFFYRSGKDSLPQIVQWLQMISIASLKGQPTYSLVVVTMYQLLVLPLLKDAPMTACNRAGITTQLIDTSRAEILTS